MKVSVIVCTYNRAQYLPTTLQRLAEQTCDSNHYEILIIDNNSTDETSNISREFIKNHPHIDCKYYLEQDQGHTFARNRGIKESNYNILSFIDDDAFVRPNFIENTIHYFSNNPSVAAIGGKIIPKYESSEPKWMSKYLWPLVAALDMGDTPKQFKGRKFPIGANMAFRKSTFDKYGIFDVELGRRGTGLEGGDEKEMFTRLKNGNEKIFYDPKVVVDHIIPDKRLTTKYIKGLAMGVGTSEKKRLKKASIISKLERLFEEVLKIAGTGVLFFYHFFRLETHAATMLIKFRFWVIQGFIK
jgi:glycosyltransferase involved in cell wall biosynthesis